MQPGVWLDEVVLRFTPGKCCAIALLLAKVEVLNTHNGRDVQFRTGDATDGMVPRVRVSWDEAARGCL